MDNGSCGADEDQLVTALNKLDAAKAFMRKSQAALDEAIRELAKSGYSRACLDAFEAMSWALNKATEDHRLAVEAFNTLCQEPGVNNLAYSAAIGSKS